MLMMVDRGGDDDDDVTTGISVISCWHGSTFWYWLSQDVLQAGCQMKAEVYWSHQSLFAVKQYCLGRCT